MIQISLTKFFFFALSFLEKDYFYIDWHFFNPNISYCYMKIVVKDQIIWKLLLDV